MKIIVPWNRAGPRIIMLHKICHKKNCWHKKQVNTFLWKTFYEKFCYKNLWSQKSFVTKKVLSQKLFVTTNFCHSKFFCHKKVLSQKKFCHKKSFVTKKFCHQKNSSVGKFFLCSRSLLRERWVPSKFSYVRSRMFVRLLTCATCFNHCSKPSNC